MEGAIEQAATESAKGECFDMTPTKGHLTEAERLVRYLWATQFAEGRRVLDAACGNGYGTRLMAAAGAAEAVGIDYDQQLLADAEADTPEQVRFEAGDLLSLPFEDESFDLIVCFQPIEHLTDPGAVLDQLSRVVTPDGLVIVSIPNRDAHAPGDGLHLRGSTPSELESALGRRFRSVSLRRQHTWVASAVLDDEAFEASGNHAVDDVDLLKLRDNRAGEETYTLGIASDGELPAGRRAVSLTDDLDLREWSTRLNAANLALSIAAADDGNPEAEVELLRRELDLLREELTKSEAELARLTGIETKLEEAKAGLASFNDLASRYAEVTGSTSWRLTSFLRQLKSKLRGVPRR